MRFLFHFYDLHQRAGIQRAICELGNALTEQGHEVVIATYSNRVESAFPLDDKVGVLKMPHPEYAQSGIHAWSGKGLWALRQVIAMRRVIKTVRPDIVVDHGTALGLLFPFGSLAGVPFVLQRHFPGRSFPHGGILYRVLALLCLSKVIVVLTESIARDMITLGFRRIEVIPNPLPVAVKAAPFPEAKPRTGLLMGRAQNIQKGFDIFLEALSIQQPEGWRFKIVGPKVESDPLLLRLIDRYKLGDCVSLHPSTQDPYSYIRECSVLIMPSRYEALPMVALEALKMGRPVIASDAEGLREIVTGENGASFPVGDTHALSAQIMRLCTDPAHLAALGGRAPATVDRFAADVVVEKWVALGIALAHKSKYRTVAG